MKPSVGRIVIFVFPDGTNKCPAVVTNVWSDTCVNLHLLRDADQNKITLDQGNFPTSVPFDETASGRQSWHWPPRVEEPTAV